MLKTFNKANRIIQMYMYITFDDGDDDVDDDDEFYSSMYDLQGNEICLGAV